MVVDPGCPIPPKVAEIHGIDDAKIAELKDQKLAPLFFQIAKSMRAFVAGADVLGFNSTNFDVPVLTEEFARAGITDWPEEDTQFIDAMAIFKKKEERTLSAAVKFYCKKEHESAHNALADVEATIEVLDAQIYHYEDLSSLSLLELADFCKYDNRIDLAGKFVKNEEGEIIVNFGKYRDVPAQEALKDKGYYKWLMDKSDLTSNSKSVAAKLFNWVSGIKETK